MERHVSIASVVDTSTPDLAWRRRTRPSRRANSTEMDSAVEGTFRDGSIRASRGDLETLVGRFDFLQPRRGLLISSDRVRIQNFRQSAPVPREIPKTSCDSLDGLAPSSRDSTSSIEDRHNSSPTGSPGVHSRRYCHWPKTSRRRC